MGLDQYLLKKHYVKNWDHNPEKYNVEVTKDGKPVETIDTSKVCRIEEDVAYWRKFNALHNWFVEKCQDGEDDCGTYYVGRSQLLELLDLLKAVKDTPDKAAELLPSRSGFFFGGTDYDEYYFQEVKETIELLEKELAKNDKDASYYYTSSW